MFISDPILGWRRKPGVYDERKESLHYKLEIGEHGYRVLPGQPDEFEKRVWIFGCSFTEGFFLPSEETFCFRLQNRFSNWLIQNFAIGGNSTFQNLLQLEANLVAETPDIVVFSYLPEHTRRSVSDPTLWKNITRNRTIKWKIRGLQPGLRTFRPTAHLDRDGSLFYGRTDPPKNGDVFDGMMKNRPDLFYQELVAAKIIRHARDMTEKAGARFFLAVLYSEESHRNKGCGGPAHLDHDPLMIRLKKAGIQIIDADPRRPFEEMTFRPIDNHPNARANAHYAQKIGDALEQFA